MLKNDKNNLAPRLGFTWDTKGDGKQLLRGGWGRYYDFPYTNATILFPAVAVQSNYGVVYNVTNPTRHPERRTARFFQPGQPLPPNQLPGLAATPPNEVASPTLATPYSEQASLGYSWQVNDWLGLNFEAVAHRLPRHPLPLPGQPDRSGRPARAASRSSATSGSGYGNGQADYDGVNFSFRARVDRQARDPGLLHLLEGDGQRARRRRRVPPDRRRLPARPSRAARDVSVNPLNPLCGACIGPLNTDARHRVTLSAVYQGPWGINVAGIFRYRSATPYHHLLHHRPERRRLPLRPAAGRLRQLARGPTRSRSSTCGCRRPSTSAPSASS